MKNFFDTDTCDSNKELWNNVKFIGLIRDSISSISKRKKINFLPHLLFQDLLNIYFWEWNEVEKFINDNWYEYINNFSNIEELKTFILINPQVILDIENWKLCLAYIFEGMKPICLVLVKQKDTPEEIRKKIKALTDMICNWTDMSDIQL